MKFETNIRKVIAERLNLTMQDAVTRHQLAHLSPKIEVLDDVIEGLVFKFKAWVLKGHHECRPVEVHVPASWWDHFKVERFPDWALDRWPAKFRTIEVYSNHAIYVCPHANVAWPDNRHIEFLWYEQIYADVNQTLETGEKPKEKDGSS